jgi:hypothetical protein
VILERRHQIVLVVPINTVHSDGATMDTQEIDDPTDEDNVPACRERAATELNQIAQEARRVLADHGITTRVFFVVPNSGRAVLMFGTPDNLGDTLWNRVGEIVSAVVRQTVGLDRTRCQELACATADDLR